MSRPASQQCPVCQSVFGDSDCTHWTGTGTTDDPYIPVPNIDDDVDNLVECGPNGLGAFLNPIYSDPPAVHAYGTVDEDEAIPWDTVWPIAFHSTRYDTDNMFDPEDPGHLTINTPGIYLVTFNCRWKKTNDSTVTGDLAAFIRQNEGNWLALDSMPVPGADSFAKHSISREHPFAAGDTISALVKQDLVNDEAEPENKINTFITVERMSPIFTAMFLRPIEGMTIVGVDTTDANPGGGSGGTGTPHAEEFLASEAGQINSTNATYSTARAGSGLTASTAGNIFDVGQLTGFLCLETFYQWDTSSIPDDATITSAVVSLHGSSDTSVTDFTVECRLHDWGATLDTGDWVAGADLGSKTLLATFPSASYVDEAYNVFTSEPEFIDNINKSGFTRVMFCSSRHRNNNQPTGNEYMTFRGDEVSAPGLSARLIVHYTTP